MKAVFCFKKWFTVFKEEIESQYRTKGPFGKGWQWKEDKLVPVVFNYEELESQNAQP